MKDPAIFILTPSLGQGGTQRVFHQQRSFLSGYFKVVSSTFNWTGSFEAERNQDIISLEVPAGGNVLTKIYYFLVRIIRVRQLKKKHNITVSISHLEGADYVNVLSKRGEKIVFYIHGTKFHDGEIKGMLGWIRKKILMPVLYRQADLIITVSAAIRLELISQLKIAENKIRTINNGFDIKWIEDKAKEQIPSAFGLLFANHAIVCLCSRLAPQKNQKAFLPVFAEVIQSTPAKLILLGDGELRTELIDQAVALELRVYQVWSGQDVSDQFDIYFLGNQSNPFSYIARTSLFVLPSGWEGFPLALCEAMACHTPVIVSDCPTGPREILDAGSAGFSSEYGVLLPVPSLLKDDIFYAWKDAVELLLKDKARASEYADKARIRVADFGIDKMQNAWMETIQSVLA